MKINCDSYFHKGHGHLVCEDYTLEENDLYKGIILADGCSSAKHTDVGARILAHLTHNWLINYANMDEGAQQFYSYFLQEGINSSIIIEGIDIIPLESFDASLSFCFVQNDLIKIAMFGDGVLVYKTEDDLHIISVEYELNMPFYFIYELFYQEKNSYKNYLIDKNIDFNKAKKIEHIIINNKGEIFVESLERSFDTPEIFEFDIDNIKFVALFSDGVKSFYNRKEQKNVHYLEIIKELLKFGNTTGKFIKRNMIAFIEGCEKEKIEFFDDLSMACISIKKEI